MTREKQEPAITLPIPPRRRAIAIIGKDVREVEYIPTPPAPTPPPRSTYRGPAQWGDTPEEEKE